MAPLKRQSHLDDHDRDGEASGNESKRRQGDSKAKRALIRTISDIAKEYVETSFRKVVRELVSPILERHLRARGQSLNQTGTSGGGRGRNFQLSFTKRLPREIFTMTKLVADDKTPLEIAVYECDGRSQDYIVTDGPLSSMKIELFVLDGKLGSNGSQDWTSEEFSACIKSKTRKGGQLLSGQRFMKLVKGVGCVPQVCFNDISIWASNSKFRLGARVVEPTLGEANIREAISEPFRVKDYRGVSYEKPDNPSLDDEVWRLKGIRKNGKRHKQLSSYGIVTVKDLLQQYSTNPRPLKEIIGNVGKRTWETLIKNAQACALQDGGNCHTYHPTEQLNAIHPYLPIGSLYSDPKCAYEGIQAGGGLQQHDLLTSQQDFSVPSTSTHFGEAVHNGESEGVELFVDLSQFLIDENFGAMPYGVEGQCSNHSSNPNSAVYIPSKGKGTAVWDKIRNTLKVAMLYLCRVKRNAKLAPRNC